MSPDKLKYSIDTSSLIHAWRRAYPIDNFPGFWHNLEDLFSAGHASCADEVFSELKKKDDELFDWCKAREDTVFVGFDGNQEKHLIGIMAEFPRLVDTTKNKSGADPFVIALALSQTPRLTVVTQEEFGKATSPKIPNVCQAKGIRSINLLDLISEMKWKFTR